MFITCRKAARNQSPTLNTDTPETPVVIPPPLTVQSRTNAGYETLATAQNSSPPDDAQSVYDEINEDDMYDEIRDPEYLELVDDDGPASPKAAVTNANTTPWESVL